MSRQIDTDVLDELIEMCETSIASRFKKAKPAAEPKQPKNDDDLDVDALSSIYEE